MNNRAYAVGFIDTTTTPPTVTGVGIFSAEAGSITTDQDRAYPFDIAFMYGDDYGDASDRVIAHLADFYPWAHALLGGRTAIQ